MVNPFEEYKKAYHKEEDINRKTQPYILNRIFSFDFDSRVHELAIELSPYLFHADNDLLLLAYELGIPRKEAPNIRYIKSDEEKAKEFDWLVDKLAKKYNWGDKDKQVIGELIAHKSDDKEWLGELFRYVGAEKSKFDEYGIDIKQRSTSNDGDLDKWF